ncbi:hypothetical protein R50072_38040 [Simiduia litorea]|uniref:hypothetical protein n=1 Tax=Simiduia litorea TaxID=1435348 RepID=UPI0036F1DA2E
MPQFTRSGDHYRVTYISGPSHVLLGLLLDEGNETKIDMVGLGAVGTCNHGSHNLENMKQGVIEGVSKANTKFSTNFSIKEIEYVENDTPNYTLYAHCAYLIIKGIYEGEQFKVFSET